MGNCPLQQLPVGAGSAPAAPGSVQAEARQEVGRALRREPECLRVALADCRWEGIHSQQAGRTRCRSLRPFE